MMRKGGSRGSEAQRREPFARGIRGVPLRTVAGTFLLCALSVGVALTAVDWVVRLGALNFQPMRSRVNADFELVRTEFRTRVVTNALGFREQRLPAPKSPGTMRIVALGDSFTQGYGVEAHEAYPQLLERLLDARDPGRRHEVVNLGVPSACALDYLAHFRDVGLSYEPDLVLIGVMANDVNDVRAIREHGSRTLPGVLQKVRKELVDQRGLWKRLPSMLWPALYEYAGARLRPLLRADASAHASASSSPRRRPVVTDDRWQEVFLRVGERYGRRSELEEELAGMTPERAARLRPVLTGEYDFEYEADPQPLFEFMALIEPRAFADMVLLPPAYDDAWDETTRALRRIDAIARQAGARTMLVFIPAGFQVTPKAWHPLERFGFTADSRTLMDTTFIERLRGFGAEIGVPVVDLLTPLRARADEPFYYPIDGHWTALGQRMAAEMLAASILAGAAPRAEVD